MLLQLACRMAETGQGARAEVSGALSLTRALHTWDSVLLQLSFVRASGEAHSSHLRRSVVAAFTRATKSA